MRKERVYNRKIKSCYIFLMKLKATTRTKSNEEKLKKKTKQAEYVKK